MDKALIFMVDIKGGETRLEQMNGSGHSHNSVKTPLKIDFAMNDNAGRRTFEMKIPLSALPADRPSPPTRIQTILALATGLIYPDYFISESEKGRDYNGAVEPFNERKDCDLAFHGVSSEQEVCKP